MRNYIPKKNNLYKLPHDMYMQMFYLLRDYIRIKKETMINSDNNTVLHTISDAVSQITATLSAEYEKRKTKYGQLDSYRAFFDYNYYSYMFAKRDSDFGASKSAWSFYKSKYAYLLAKQLKLI